MVLFMAIFGVLAAAFAAEAARRTDMLRLARERLTELEARPAAPAPPPPAPVRLFECRREHRGLLWFLVLTIQEDSLQVVRVSSGLPHCPRCVAPLKLSFGTREEWLCVGCGARHPGTDAGLKAVDALLIECLRELFARHPDFTPAPGLAGPKFEPPLRRAAPHPQLNSAERTCLRKS